jgi:host factor-I protein
MKDGLNPTAVGRAPEPEPEEFTSRKLIRPSLSRADELRNSALLERRERVAERIERAAAAPTAKKTPPAEQTHAENFYYQKQIQTKTPMVVVLQNGEQVHGVIEWYDRNCIKLNRAGASNLLIYKPSIKYMYKESESR